MFRILIPLYVRISDRECVQRAPSKNACSLLNSGVLAAPRWDVSRDAGMSGGVSVVICCFNSAKRLPETLRHLAAQRVPEGIPWEIVVVDNASTDGTAETALRNWPASAFQILRVVSESQAGLSHARVRGIREARYEIISFIDDDNWVPADWVARVEMIFAGDPEIAASGSRIEAVCEIAPPPWFSAIQGHYAVGRQHAHSGDVTEKPGTLLCGAGLSLRTAALRQLLNAGFAFRMTGRKGNRVLTGEDTELCFALRAAGWKIWYDDDLVLQHFIPATRLHWEYALRLMEGTGESSALFAVYLFALNGPPFGNYPAWKRTWMFQFLKVLRQYVGMALTHPEACFRQTEGAMPVLKLQIVKGSLAGWWALRKHYQELQEQIRQSAWAAGGREKRDVSAAGNPG